MNDSKLDDTIRRIETIEERNRRVELEKAWEISLFRKTTIAIITYLIASLFLYLIEAKEPFLNAFVPMIGYILSVQSLPIIKRWWINKYSQ